MTASSPTIRFLDWSALRWQLIWIYDGQVPANSVRLRTDHRSGGIWAWLVRRGSVRVSVGGKTDTAGAGQWMVPARDVVLQDFSDDAALLSIRFEAAWPNGDSMYRLPATRVFGAAECPGLERAGRRLERAVRTLYPDASIRLLEQPAAFDGFCEVQIRLAEWVRAFAETMASFGEPITHLSNLDERVVAMMMILDKLPLRSPPRLSELAARVGLSASQLDRLFRRDFGVSPLRYFDQRRLRESTERVKFSNEPFKEIAFELGFCSPSHFTKWFVRHNGTPPSQLRSGRP